MRHLIDDHRHAVLIAAELQRRMRDGDDGRSAYDGVRHSIAFEQGGTRLEFAPPMFYVPEEHHVMAAWGRVVEIERILRDRLDRIEEITDTWKPVYGKDGVGTVRVLESDIEALRRTTPQSEPQP